MALLDYFDRLAIIHLPDRADRYRALRHELSRIGIDIECSKVSMLEPPVPETANGFPSRGVYSCFLSHLEVIEGAYRDGLNTVWVLEDDAIFSEKFKKQQTAVAEYLRANEWDQLFIGHTLFEELPASPTGLLRYSGSFIWAHCYAVHRRIMPWLIDYLRKTIERESGHPDGGKVHIDAAYFLFRQFNPDVMCIVSSPCFSVQKGSQSSLNSPSWYQKAGFGAVVNIGREIRDEFWRKGWLRIDGPQDVMDPHVEIKSAPARTWPGN
ncbi:MAG: glycosyltransferase family 25 protein [Terracidiphilus sp.]